MLCHLNKLLIKAKSYILIRIQPMIHQDEMTDHIKFDKINEIFTVKKLMFLD